MKKVKILLMILLSTILLSSCDFQPWNILRWEVSKKETNEEQLANKICQWIWYSKWTIQKVHDNINTKIKMNKNQIDCFKEWEETSDLTLEYSDMKYYENSRKACDHNWYSFVYKIERQLSNQEVVWQKVSCFSTKADLDKTKIFTTEFSNQDLK